MKCITMPYWDAAEIPKSGTLNIKNDCIVNSIKVFLVKDDFIKEVTNCYIVHKNKISFPNEMIGMKIYIKYDRRIVELEDFVLALGGWYCAMNSEWTGDGCAFDDPELKALMKKYDITKDELLESIPKEWIT